MNLKSKYLYSILCLSLLFNAHAFADATSTAGAQAGAGASAVSQSGGGSGGQGGLGVGQGGQGGVSLLQQQNDINTQSGAMGNQTSTNLTFGGTTIPANTTANNTIRTIVEGKQSIENVPSMGAPGLTTTLTETCMGSSSGAVSVLGTGVSGGTTWTDTRCADRLDAREMKTYGPDGILAAKQIMCENNPVVQMAWRKIGKPCIGYEVDPALAKKDQEKRSWSSLPEASESDQGHPANPTQWWQKKLSHKP